MDNQSVDNVQLMRSETVISKEAARECFLHEGVWCLKQINKQNKELLFTSGSI